MKAHLDRKLLAPHAKSRPSPVAGTRFFESAMAGHEQIRRILRPSFATSRPGDLVELTLGPGPQLRLLDAAATSDPLERAADRVAAQVKDGSGGAACNQPHGGACAGSAAGTVQRVAEPASPVRAPVGLAGSARLARIEAPGPQSSGSPLASDVRRRIEPVLGVDLSHVRVHTDEKARGVARELRARAFTYGSDIWLGPGQRADDVELLAHESAHVVQQGAAGHAPCVQRQPDPATPEWEEPSPLWLEVNDAYKELCVQIGLINQGTYSPTRGDWISKLASGWSQVGAPGKKSDAELRRLRADLDALRKETAEEDVQAHESWKSDVASYQAERKVLEGEKEEWAPAAIKILDDKYADTGRSVHAAGAYLTFDDMVPLEYTLTEKKHRIYAKERIERKKEKPSLTAAGSDTTGTDWKDWVAGACGIVAGALDAVTFDRYSKWVFGEEKMQEWREMGHFDVGYRGSHTGTDVALMATGAGEIYSGLKAGVTLGRPGVALATAAVSVDGTRIASGFGQMLWADANLYMSIKKDGRGVGGDTPTIGGRAPRVPTGGDPAAAKQVFDTLPKGLFEWGKCKEAAKAMVKALKDRGISGQVLEFTSKRARNGLMVSDLYRSASKPIGETAEHMAVKVGDMVFDNLLRNGTPYKEYVDALHVAGGSVADGAITMTIYPF